MRGRMPDGDPDDASEAGYRAWHVKRHWKTHRAGLLFLTAASAFRWLSFTRGNETDAEEASAVAKLAILIALASTSVVAPATYKSSFELFAGIAYAIVVRLCAVHDGALPETGWTGVAARSAIAFFSFSVARSAFRTQLFAHAAVHLGGVLVEDTSFRWWSPDAPSVLAFDGRWELTRRRESKLTFVAICTLHLILEMRGKDLYRRVRAMRKSTARRRGRGGVHAIRRQISPRSILAIAANSAVARRLPGAKMFMRISRWLEQLSRDQSRELSTMFVWSFCFYVFAVRVALLNSMDLRSVTFCAAAKSYNVLHCALVFALEMFLGWGTPRDRGAHVLYVKKAAWRQKWLILLFVGPTILMEGAGCRLALTRDPTRRDIGRAATWAVMAPAFRHAIIKSSGSIVFFIIMSREVMSRVGAGNAVFTGYGEWRGATGLAVVCTAVAFLVAFALERNDNRTRFARRMTFVDALTLQSRERMHEFEERMEGGRETKRR